MLIFSSSATIEFVSDASDARAGFSIQYKAVDEDFQLGEFHGHSTERQTVNKNSRQYNSKHNRTRFLNCPPTGFAAKPVC